MLRIENQNYTFFRLAANEWERSFHDHFIRDDISFERIARYVINNPMKWVMDRFYNKNRLRSRHNFCLVKAKLLISR